MNSPYPRAVRPQDSPTIWRGKTAALAGLAFNALAIASGLVVYLGVPGLYGFPLYFFIIFIVGALIQGYSGKKDGNRWAAVSFWLSLIITISPLILLFTGVVFSVSWEN